MNGSISSLSSFSSGELSDSDGSEQVNANRITIEPKSEATINKSKKLTA